jgi:Tfp pilus assembly protein PilX
MSMHVTLNRMKQKVWIRRRQEGVALLTVMLLMVALTVIGIAAVTVTSLENRMAGFGRMGEAGASAAEACLGTAVRVIQNTIDNAQVPAGGAAGDYRESSGGPVPDASVAGLEAEIMGQSDNNNDTPSTNPPNTRATINGFTITGDIDRLYAVPKAGGSLQFAAGYEGTAGGAAGGGVDIMYRIDCQATNAITGTNSRVTAVYACTATGETCQRKI